MHRWIVSPLMMALLISVSIASAAFAPSIIDEEAVAQALPDDLAPIPVAGLFEFPWSIGFLPGGSFLVTERPGRLLLIEPGATTEIKGLPPVRTGDQGGLLDIAVGPDFSRSHILYLSYTHGTMTSSTVRIVRGRLDLTEKAFVDQVVLFESDPPASANEQLGGRLGVTRDGYLFLSLGDRWEPGRARDLSDHGGSIIRIRTDGSVPDSNPFISVPGAQAGDLVLWPPESSRTGRRCRQRADLGHGAWPTRWRRTQLDPSGPELRLADDRPWQEL
jgi:glucose/arabinose dehydrogenase